MSKTCHECKIENEEQYIYCKNCGAILPPSDNNIPKETTAAPAAYVETKDNSNSVAAQSPAVPTTNVETKDNSDPVTSSQPPEDGRPEYSAQSAAYSYANSASIFDGSIGGLDKKDFMVFLGKNAPKIYSKFVKMEISSSKVSWCWPAAILTILFGFLGGAIWFFYRKMYKIALILLAAGIIFTGVKTALTLDHSVNAINAFYGMVEDIIENPELYADGSYEAYDSITNSFSDILQSASTAVIASNIFGLIESFAGGILIGIFAMYFYKKHATNKLLAYRNTSQDEQYYHYGLTLIGGTSGGMLALGIIVFIVVSNIAGLLPFAFAGGY